LIELAMQIAMMNNLYQSHPGATKLPYFVAETLGGITWWIPFFFFFWHFFSRGMLSVISSLKLQHLGGWR